MDLSVYLEPRKFRQAYTERTQIVGVSSVLWAMLSGPFYFWKKGARSEALLLAMACVPALFAGAPHSPIDPELLTEFTSLVWVAVALLAPLLLMRRYRRQGWAEIDAALKTRAIHLRAP
jgi:hypothetical protein